MRMISLEYASISLIRYNHRRGLTQGYVKGHIAMERRILVVPRTEPFGFTKVTEVSVNSRVTGIQMYFDLRLD